MNVLAQPRAVRTACPYCGVGCGVLARPKETGGVVISGDPDHPANFGRLCSKGFALDETLNSPDRLLHPLIKGADGSLSAANWDAALEIVATGLTSTINQHGPDAVAFYLSGQLLTEDYYVANKLMKGFIGSANVDTNSRLCMASSVAGHRRAFGADVVPGNYDDLDEAELIVLVGSNTAWCHPVLFQRMLRARAERGTRIVVIDPRRTYTAEDADLFLSIAPGTDSILFSGLLVHLADAGDLDQRYIDSHTAGFDETLAHARAIAPDLTATAAKTGLGVDRVSLFFDWFSKSSRVVTCYSQGVNQSVQGTDKVNAIINCHLATGRIGKPGASPFSLTGQPNAMGGREVGGLANQLAAHMGFIPEHIDRVRRFWRAPRMATHEGLKAIDMFDAIASGKIKALWVMATNPAASLPDSKKVRDALGKLDLLVVSDYVNSNDTINSGAHVVFPAAPWGERDGTVTNSERRISRQRAFLAQGGDARPDWQIVCDVARRMGFGDAFGYKSLADIFREHAALSCFENNGSRAFDIGALAAISDSEYERLEPVQWPVRADGSQDARLFSNGAFFTPDRKARFVAPESPRPRADLSPDFPLRLNTGRIRDQWHTMTRSGDSARLAGHRVEPFVEVHPLDAVKFRLTQDGFARVSTRYGACTLKVIVTAAQQPGSVFVPIHWTRETSSSAAIGQLVSPDVDPISGQPDAKATPASVEPITFAVRGFAISRESLRFSPETWWSRTSTDLGRGYLLASNGAVANWRNEAPSLFTRPAVLTEYFDRSLDVYRAAAFVDGRLEGVLFVGRGEYDTTICGQFTGQTSSHPLEPTVCACFDVGMAAVRHALASSVATDTAGIGRALRAGTKCGTCLSELRSLVAHAAPAHAH
ncbi:MAG: assimilatory nitrate reductase catalytic subunit [Variibacter sp.]|jgi:assimilatory nitrate reductase catalytic subunit|nr:assimilatory nitrate reductase catalytic subunit [Variibacter sp.]